MEPERMDVREAWRRSRRPSPPQSVSDSLSNTIQHWLARILTFSTSCEKAGEHPFGGSGASPLSITGRVVRSDGRASSACYLYRRLLAAFYTERYRDRTIWTTRLEWFISPDDSRLDEIPESDQTYLCAAENGTALDNHEEDKAERQLRAKAEEQAQALGRLIYPELDD
jgi:hypothetical protein